jgi:Mg-chelatase subunit ChlD
MSSADCHAGAAADIVFVLDSSGSVGQANYQKMLQFVKSMASNFPIGSDKVRIGVETFSSRPYTEFNLNKNLDHASVATAIDHISYKSGGTNTGTALKDMYTKMFTAPNGDRPGVPNIAIVVTDGRSNNRPSTLAEAAKAKALGIEVFSVGVGAGVDVSELNAIASDPDAGHVMTVTDFSKLQQIQSAFAAKTCAGMLNARTFVT